MSVMILRMTLTDFHRQAHGINFLRAISPRSIRRYDCHRPRRCNASLTHTATAAANTGVTDGIVTKVDFYNGSTLLGTATSAPLYLQLEQCGAGDVRHSRHRDRYPPGTDHPGTPRLPRTSVTTWRECNLGESFGRACLVDCR